MSDRKLSLKPKAARVTHGKAEAWWYDERGGITVVVATDPPNPIFLHIKRSALARYLERSAR